MKRLTDIFSRKNNLPEFVVGETYFNEDYGGEIIITNKKPFKVLYDYRDEPMDADRELYRQKLKEGIIYAVHE